MPRSIVHNFFFAITLSEDEYSCVDFGSSATLETCQNSTHKKIPSLSSYAQVFCKILGHYSL